MRILIDTDVLLDVALGRSEFADASASVLRWVESGGAGAIAWHSISNCAYLLEGNGRDFLGQLLSFMKVAPVGTSDAQMALTFPMKDLEDALQAASALSWKADYIVTRNLQHYRKSPVPSLSPVNFIKLTKRA
jgi:hypothetical protein